ncbi:Mitochondrial substrate carrier family protein isoform 1 [Hibiscus syriacus]|uniref:Mitochondrial substrate carrier family protein isoform 1 n=1 Tax=Hibiscus syriacus TaxID=106335 RepID=A0A6A2YDR2_HIBSY|nr:uncharacterized protein LOC120165008 [Hibiscus syriacus]KAE8676966.1 Mitochondrial substrate carrier family protein isoform 1 [Hibiscus syriacus]
MEKGTTSQHSSMPLVSRLDHLDFMMKYLEGKISLQKGMEKACLPLDLAMREAYFKGSLLDRVTSLEHRLFQLCLDLESSSTLSTLTSTSGYASSSQGSRAQPIPRSIPTFANSNKLRKEEARLPLLSRSQIQGESETMLPQKKKDLNPLKHKRSSKKEIICSNSGKKVSPNWSHWKILGC